MRSLYDTKFPLHAAVRRGDVEQVQYLLDHDVDVNGLDNDDAVSFIEIRVDGSDFFRFRVQGSGIPTLPVRLRICSHAAQRPLSSILNC